MITRTLRRLHWRIPDTWNLTVLKARLPELWARRIMITHMNPTMLARVVEAKSLGLLVAEDGLAVDV